jgi:ABC-type branched-subunit amino acid transport system substrate-binding protein
MKKIIISVLVIVVVILLVLSQRSSNETVGTIKIGVIGPFSGPAQTIGEEIMNSILLASSSRLQISFEDDQCDSKKAISSYEKLKLQSVHVYYVACSGSVLALSPIVKEDNNVILTAYAGSSAIRETGDEVIRFIPDALSIADKMAQYSKQIASTSKIGLLYEKQDYSVSVANILKKELGSIIKVEETYSGDDSSFRTQIVKLKASGIYIYYIFQPLISQKK